MCDAKFLLFIFLRIYLPANLCHAIYRVSHGGNDDDENDGGDLDYLVDCRGIILAYAGSLFDQHAFSEQCDKHCTAHNLTCPHHEQESSF